MPAHIPRRSFAAPFILTIASACAPDAAEPGPSDQTWIIRKEGETCQAQSSSMGGCPRGASCNPPAPFELACPTAITQYPAKVVRHAKATECKVETLAADAMHEDTVPCPN